MNPLIDKQIADLVIAFQPESFSSKRYPEGFEVIYDLKKNELSTGTPGFFGKLLGGGGKLTHYFVKKTKKPVNVKDVEFTWKEGNSDLSLDFSGTFALQINTEEDAKNLIKAIHHQNGPAKGLQEQIESAIYEVIRDKLKFLRQDPDKESPLIDPLWEFIHNESLDGLGQIVSVKVKGLLDIPHFEIGLRLFNLPPEDISFKDFESPFRLQDIDRNWSLKKTVDLRLNRLDKVKRSGYHSKEEIKNYICKYINLSVVDHIQGKTFYDFVEHFDMESNNSLNNAEIKNLIKKDISNKAEAIGYRLNMFHTLPNIQSLKLKDGWRIEIPGPDATVERQAKYSFRTKDMSAPVSLDMAINVFARDYSKLKSLIQPGDENIFQEIEKLVIITCRDVIIKISRKNFNLNFLEPTKPATTDLIADLKPEDEQSVEFRLTKALENTFDRYGLVVNVIHIAQAKTEDAERFDGLVGKGTEFKLRITPQANFGKGDVVKYDGVFELLSLSKDGWEAFERKDNGYRRISSERSGFRMIRFLETRGNAAWSDRLEQEWKAQCLDDQLNEIAKRITDILDARFSKIDDFANRGRTLKQDNEIMELMSQLAKRSIAEEFGLEIAIRSLKRLDSETDEISRRVNQLGLHADIEALEDKIAHIKAIQQESNHNQISKMREDETILSPKSESSDYYQHQIDTSHLKILIDTKINQAPLSIEFEQPKKETDQNLNSDES